MKRILDLILSGLVLLVMAIPMIAIAIAIYFQFGMPIVFRQTRAGQCGKPFEIVKFRTMRHVKPGEAELETDEQRLTRFGRWLRASSLDELPELLNVLRGEMSLVGPRPLLMEYLPLYSAKQARRHEVRPGITGLAQVSGRNALSWKDRFDLDVWYVDNHSLWLDMKILGMTIMSVVRREGISQPGEATMKRFSGNG